MADGAGPGRGSENYTAARAAASARTPAAASAALAAGVSSSLYVYIATGLPDSRKKSASAVSNGVRYSGERGSEGRRVGRSLLDARPRPQFSRPRSHPTPLGSR